MSKIKNVTNFGEWLEKNFIEWERSTGRRRTIKEFAEWLGINRSLLSRYMSNKVIPGEDAIPLIAAKLGPEIYDILGLASPDPLLRYVSSNWHKLPEETQLQIREQVETYLANGQRTKTKPST